MSEFFGWGGYSRTPEGYMSWQHLLFSTVWLIAFVLAGVFVGLWGKKQEGKLKNRPLLIAAIIIDSFELFRIIFLCFREHDPWNWRMNLPLFLCSIQFITIPMAALTKGRVKEACLDFVFCFGILGAVMGNYFAGQNFAAYPVMSFDNMASAITHSISGFASLYIVISGMASMKWKNMAITCSIMVGVGVLAYIADITIPYNYMFLMRGDGTPYDIFYNLVNGNPVLYPLIVIGLFFAYIAVFYGCYNLIVSLAYKRKAAKSNA